MNAVGACAWAVVLAVGAAGGCAPASGRLRSEIDPSVSRKHMADFMDLRLPKSAIEPSLADQGLSCIACGCWLRWKKWRTYISAEDPVRTVHPGWRCDLQCNHQQSLRIDLGNAII